MATFTSKHRGRAACGHSAFPSFAVVEGARGSRSAWLAGASLIALAAFGAPRTAFAGCTGADQTLPATVQPGPVTATNGAITLPSGGTINGGPDGVDSLTCSITTLTNNGTINAGSGLVPAPTGSRVGAGVANSNTITLLTNSGTIAGGGGNNGVAAGAGVWNTGNLIQTLTNNSTIEGGAGKAGAAGMGSGGAGIFNNGGMNYLTNNGAIAGGAGVATNPKSYGGVGVLNLPIQEIYSLTNNAGAVISGGNGGLGGPGVDNYGDLPTLANYGTIRGGDGQGASQGGAGVATSDMLIGLINGGT